MARIKNMGTSTMRFNEGIIVSGSISNPSHAYAPGVAIVCTGSVEIAANGTNSRVLRILSDGSQKEMTFQIANPGEDLGSIFTNPDNNFVVSGSYDVEILAGTNNSIKLDKKAGIGTHPDPGYNFHVSGSTTTYVLIGEGGDGHKSTQQAGIILSADKGDQSVTGSFIVESLGAGGSLNIGTESDHNVNFRVNSSNRMILSSSGDVGIGITNPESRLHINDTTGQTILTIGSLTTQNELSQIQLKASKNSNSVNAFLASADAITSTPVGSVGTLSDHDFTIKTNSTNQVIVKNTGNVGIGTIDPFHKLHVASDNLLVSDANSAAGQISVMKESDPLTNIGNGTNLGTINFGSYGDPSNQYVASAKIKATGTEGWSTGNYGSKISFYVAENSMGSHNIGVSRMDLTGNQLDINVGTIDAPTSTLTALNLTASNNIKTNNLDVNNALTVNTIVCNELQNINNQAIITFNTSNSDIILNDDHDLDTVIMGGVNNKEMFKVDNESNNVYMRGTVFIGNHTNTSISGSLDNASTGLFGCVPSPGGINAPSHLNHKSVSWPRDSNWWGTYAPSLYVENTKAVSDHSIAMFVNTHRSQDADGIKIILGQEINTHESGGTSPNPSDQNSFLVFETPTVNVDTSDEYIDNIGSNYFWNDTQVVGRLAGDGAEGIRIFGDTFTGHHDSCSIEDIEIGKIVESTGDLWISSGVSTSLPYIKSSNTRMSKAVYGVVAEKSIESGRSLRVGSKYPYTINSLGEGKVWVTNISGNITNGDYVTSSEIKGHGMLQNDDILHNYTVAKCTQTIDWNSITDLINHEGIAYKKVLISCTYHCG